MKDIFLAQLSFDRGFYPLKIIVSEVELIDCR